MGYFKILKMVAEKFTLLKGGKNFSPQVVSMKTSIYIVNSPSIENTAKKKEIYF